MKKRFLLLSFFIATQGFSTIIDRIEKIEREINQYKESRSSEDLQSDRMFFDSEKKGIYFELYPEFLLMQVKKDAKEQGLVYMGSVLGRDWSSDLKGKETLPWSWGYKINGSVNIASYDISASYLSYKNQIKETNDQGLRSLSLKASDLCLGYKQGGFGLVEFKRFLGVKKLSINTEEIGGFDNDNYSALAKTRFQALGPMASLQLKLNFLAGMHIHGSFGGSIVYGQEESWRQLMAKNGESLLSPMVTSSRTLIPSFDFRVGGGWDLVDEKNILIGLSVGYQAHYYYLHHPMNHLGQSLSSIIKVDLDKKNSLMSDLTLFGSVIRLETKF
ncbi:hypothetical protein COB21_02810 [Candidatus Aerophobetes bacterium]|uniref:Uncharacterized protein n=1 Tax=Aerophobetes bacterium TaxID=2030807 RepID=A0A2A4X6J0_UNCAE|nr:MAG: hypothetical protein COB21_02810 [Candidatus Aerophobetes bacterium]